MNRDNNEAFYNRSLERALQILIAFNKDRQTLTLAQLSDLLDLPRATVLRLCSTLIKYGFLKQDAQSKLYSLGLTLFELGSVVFYSLSLRKTASPFLTGLHEKIHNKTIFLAILDKDELLYIDKREDPKNPITFTSKVGTRRPPYWGMLGPAIMAFLPDKEIEILLKKHPLAAYTKKSFVNKAAFLKELQQIRKQGFALDNETSLEGITGIAAPIYDYSGKVIASVGAGFITSSVDAKGLRKISGEVVDAAKAISREMRYVEPK